MSSEVQEHEEEELNVFVIYSRVSESVTYFVTDGRSVGQSVSQSVSPSWH
jgi:hypothetical protein